MSYERTQHQLTVQARCESEGRTVERMEAILLESCPPNLNAASSTLWEWSQCSDWLTLLLADAHLISVAVVSIPANAVQSARDERCQYGRVESNVYGRTVNDESSSNDLGSSVYCSS